MSVDMRCDASSLRETSLKIRRKLLDLHFKRRAGHLGGAFSCVDFLVYLYWCQLRTEDVFVLSKGHSASALYGVFFEKGIFTAEQLATYYQDGTFLAGHTPAQAFLEIPVATGSLGHGLSVVAGMAYVNQVVRPTNRRFFCLVSDGECNEGSVWEAALFINRHNLRNLVLVVDYNRLQGFGRSDEVMGLVELERKFEGFGFNVSRVDGHDFEAMDRSFQSIDSASSGDRPVCVILDTIKGKGVSFMEDRLEWHYLSMNQAQYDEALRLLESSEKGGVR